MGSQICPRKLSSVRRYERSRRMILERKVEGLARRIEIGTRCLCPLSRFVSLLSPVLILRAGHEPILWKYLQVSRILRWNSPTFLVAPSPSCVLHSSYGILIPFVGWTRRPDEELGRNVMQNSFDERGRDRGIFGRVWFRWEWLRDKHFYRYLIRYRYVTVEIYVSQNATRLFMIWNVCLRDWIQMSIF